MDNKDFEKKIINSLAVVSYEMGTPINLIASTAKLINMKIDTDCDAESIKAYMKNIMNNCNKMALLISNIMDINMTVVSKKEYVNANQFFETFCSNIEPFLNDANVKLKKEFKAIKENIEISLNTTERILLNLITNAIKYNDKKNKQITIKMNVKDDCVIFSVKDNGIGISEENIEKITEKFFRVNNTIANGLGLGLSLVDNYLKSMGGSMEIKSQLKKGTEFIVSIPVTPDDKMFTTSESIYIYKPEKSNFYIEFAQFKNTIDYIF